MHRAPGWMPQAVRIRLESPILLEIRPRRSALNVLQKYLFREWFWTVLAVTVVLMIVLLGVFLGEMLNDIADGRMPPALLGIQLLLYLPSALGTILPLAAFVAVMWGLGRLYRDQEMAVMRSSGFDTRMLFRPLMALALPIAALLLLNELVVTPRTTAEAERRVEDALRSAALWGLKPGQFHVLQGGDLVIYIERVGADGRSLENIFVQQRRDDREQVWMAKAGRYWYDEETDARFLTLENGHITDRQPGRLDLRLLEFGRNDLKLPNPEPRDRSDDLASTPSKALLGTGDLAATAELQWRFSPALAVIVLAALAVPLSHSAPREGRGGRVVLGMLAYAIYANLLYLGRSWVADGSLAAMPGLWWIHVLVLATALLWMQSQGRLHGPRLRRARR